MKLKALRILKPQELDALTPEERREYMRAVAHRVAEEDREALDMLAAYDRGETQVVPSRS